MSDILTNAMRYDATNTIRVYGGKGALAIGGKLAFDCSGFQNWIYRESGYRFDYTRTTSAVDSKGNLTSAGQSYFNPVAAQNLKAGDTVYFKDQRYRSRFIFNELR